MSERAPVVTMTESASYTVSRTQTLNGRCREVDLGDLLGEELGAEALGLLAEA